MNVRGEKKPSSSNVSTLPSSNIIWRDCQIVYKTRRDAPSLKLEERVKRSITRLHIWQQVGSRVSDRLQDHQRSLQKYWHLILTTEAVHLQNTEIRQMLKKGDKLMRQQWHRNDQEIISMQQIKQSHCVIPLKINSSDYVKNCGMWEYGTDKFFPEDNEIILRLEQLSIPSISNLKLKNLWKLWNLKNFIMKKWHRWIQCLYMCE